MKMRRSNLPGNKKAQQHPPSRSKAPHCNSQCYLYTKQPSDDTVGPKLATQREEIQVVDVWYEKRYTKNKRTSARGDNVPKKTLYKEREEIAVEMTMEDLKRKEILFLYVIQKLGTTLIKEKPMNRIAVRHRRIIFIHKLLQKRLSDDMACMLYLSIQWLHWLNFVA